MDILQNIPELKTMQQLTLKSEELMEEMQTVCNKITQAATQGYFIVELDKRDFIHFRTIMSLLVLKGYTVDTYDFSLKWTIAWKPTQDNN